MDQESHHRLKAIFGAARELEGPEREAYLEQACSGDPTLRAEVVALLESDPEAASFLGAGDGSGAARAAAALAEEATAHAAALVGERIGRYHVRRLIASGGMGSVYEAEQDSPRRIVASMSRPLSSPGS